MDSGRSKDTSCSNAREAGNFFLWREGCAEVSPCTVHIGLCTILEVTKKTNEIPHSPVPRQKDDARRLSPAKSLEFKDALRNILSVVREQIESSTIH
jgi:hypothetical protein